MKKKTIIGLAGMPGSGKATVREIAQGMGYPVVVMGDVVREEARRRGMGPTPENLGWIMLKLREERGSAVIARRCIPKVQNLEERVVVIDGIRSLHEVEEFRKHFPNFTLIVIHSSPETRFQRLLQRGRSDDPRNRKAFTERDMRELRVGLGDVLATADHMIVNEGTRGQLKRKVRRVLKSVLEE